ncbi:unnamed protein product [Rotaria sp. Silwood2]|nr:unnamed protein product [Rotaria sp. Silwood2]CAF3073927.1 unnamed protein product [Rotaria sp. Silwood2]CAF4292092.1 unnamed protein product [Rotaria sp. Silwood2]CAF4292112.1 unnamed protein product [Rotaria sp. Silwood2]CAF4516427.1 unnamed protein product [Rotaria sp. Silwood2]
MTTEENSYAKRYTSKRKVIEDIQEYHVVIFPCDNSFSVVKAKQCSPAEHDGYVMIQSGGRKYTGFVFETGSLQKCSKAADLLSQKQHEDIESDYERGKENSSSNNIISMITSGSLHFNDARQREKADSLSLLKRQNLGHKKKSKVVQKKNGISSSDTESDHYDPVEPIEIIKTPTFNGRRLVSSNTAYDSVNSSVHKDSELKSIEIKYLIPMLSAQQKLEIMMQSLYKNQTSIQKALKRREILVSLEEPGTVPNDDLDFPRSLIFKWSDTDPGIDLLKLPGTKEKANLYVTCLIEKMFTINELVELKPADTYNDNRYKMIRGNRSLFLVML